MAWLLRVIDIVALTYAVLEFPVPVYWLILHPGIRFWRRMGYRSFWIALPLWLACGTALILLRHRLFMERLPRSPLTYAVGGALLVVALSMDWNVNHTFSFKKLAGLPEVNPSHPLRGVVSSKLYSQMRHPRYVHLTLGFFAFALLTGAEGIFLLAILTVLLYLVVAPLEEKELREQYGADYEAYAREVPRFLPRFGRRIGKSS